MVCTSGNDGFLFKELIQTNRAMEIIVDLDIIIQYMVICTAFIYRI